MIGKVMPKRRDGRSSFRSLIQYVAVGVKNGRQIEKIRASGSFNILDLSTAAAEMEACAHANPRCPSPAMHFMMSWRPGENPADQQIRDAVWHALNRLGLTECQVVWGVHDDTDCIHVHVAVNRVHPETYRAIDPAHGWTKNELERACREIEVVQGWEIETRGKYAVVDGQVVTVEKAKHEKRVSQPARDFEARTGERSAERIAIDEAAPIILSAVTWAELHIKLAAIGARYLTKGSGAILAIGETHVKASKAHRDATLSKLTKRLGGFEPAQESLQVVTRAPQPIKPMPGIWSDYAEARVTVKTGRKRARQKLARTLRRQFQELKALQYAERRDFYNQDWLGRGYEMHTARSRLAARHAAQRVSLREQQQAQRQAVSKHWRLISFREALAQNRKQPELAHAVLDALRHKKPIAALYGPDVPAKPIDIRSFTSQAQRHSVIYRSVSGASFVDFGRKILVQSHEDVSAILAALQVAAQKWGGKVTIGGPEPYQRLAIRLALAEGIKIANQDLHPIIEQERAMLAGFRQLGSNLPQRHKQQGDNHEPHY